MYLMLIWLSQTIFFVDLATFIPYLALFDALHVKRSPLLSSSLVFLPDKTAHTAFLIDKSQRDYLEME